MLELSVTSALLDEIEGYMTSSDCHMVKGMAKDGLSAEAMLFMLQSIFDRVNEARIILFDDQEGNDDDN